MVLGFSASLLAARYDEPKPIPELHDEMWALCCSKYPQVAIAAPRAHAKSTAITFAYVLAELMFRTARHVLILSSNETIAGEFVNDIKVELQENELLQETFGPFHFLRESTTEIVVQFPDKSKFRVIAKGAGQRMRGIKWERKRPDLVIGDDMEDEELVMNEERRDKFRRWFYGAVRPIVKSGGRLRVVGTILHMDSLLERWMPKPKDPNTVHRPLRDSFRHMPKSGWWAVKYRAHEQNKLRDPDCQVLWPEQFNLDDLRTIRADFAAQNMLDTYGQEYLNNPIDESTAFFKREDFLPMTERDHLLRKNYYVGCDLAISERKRSAFSVFVVGGQDEHGVTHIVDVQRGKWDAYEIIDVVFKLNEKWEHPHFRFEKENIARTIKPILDMEMLKRQQLGNKYAFVNYDMEIPIKDKEARNRAFQARHRSHNLRFDMAAEWYPDYEEELAHFPKWPTLDQADASGWLGLLLDTMIEAPTDKELEDELYLEQQHEWGDDGRSSFTGY